MKPFLVLGLGSALLFSGMAAMAQGTKVPASGDKAAMPSMAMMNPMDEHIAKMQSLHDRMMAAATAADRQKVGAEARKEMQDGMATMKPMMQGSGMMAQQGSTGDTNSQMQMMTKRMDMMHSMMQMMMDQQTMTAADASKKRHLHPRDEK